jgi:hypothetical protein
VETAAPDRRKVVRETNRESASGSSEVTAER